MPNGEDVLVDRGMRVSCVYQGDDTVLVTYSYYIYTPGVYGCKREIEQFPLRVGEKVVKKYYEQSSMRLNVIWTYETEISLVPLEENKDFYFRLYGEHGENDYDLYIGQPPRHKHPKEAHLGSMDPDSQAEYAKKGEN